MELEALNEAADDIYAAGGTPIVISPQLRKYAMKTRTDKKLLYDVLIDPGNAYAKQLGIVHRLPEDLCALYRRFGIDLPAYNGDDNWELPMPFRGVVDANGVLRYLDINADYTVRPEVDDSLRVLKKIGDSQRKVTYAGA